MKPLARIAGSLVLLGLLCVSFRPLAARAEAASLAPNHVDVILWFDTEDYLLPADDDACKRLAEMLTARGIQATFKVVGEKARVLERRGRTDVINALRQHVIAYHANFHSVHPTPSEYLREAGLLDGMSEFIRREGRGAADVRRIFQVDTLACYGQPGSSWASQAIAALPSIGVAPHGVPCYVDEGDHVGLNEQPFWYAGALVVYHMGRNYTRMELHDPAAVQPAQEKFRSIAERLQSQGGGLISIFYHPCEWVHQEFWDGVNFRRGANPPREQWKAPPQRPAAETEAAFARFGQYIDYIRSVPQVRFITARDLPNVYPDPLRTTGASQAELAAVAQHVLAGSGTGEDYLVLNGRDYSLADEFELLTTACAALLESRRPQFPIVTTGLLGPDGEPPRNGRVGSVPWLGVRDTTRDVLDYLRMEHRVPARIFIGAEAISPLQYLVALASVYRDRIDHADAPAPASVAFGAAPELLPAQHVAKDTPGLFGGWIIHPEGFRAPKILEVARWQAWTLKPALRAAE